MLTNLDDMYYRNADTITNQRKCSKYKFLNTYSSCSEDKVRSTVVKENTIPVDRKAAATFNPLEFRGNTANSVATVTPTDTTTPGV